MHKFSTLASKVVHEETDVSGSCAHVILANFSDKDLKLPKATVLGVAEEMSESLVNDINEVQKPAKSEPNKLPRRRKNKALYQKILQGKHDHLTEEERQVIEPILWKYAHVFHDEKTNDFPRTNIVELYIPVDDVQPIRRPPYRTPFALRQEMQSQIQTMLDKLVIRKSHYPWSAPAILFPKKSADGKPKYRFCFF